MKQLNKKNHIVNQEKGGERVEQRSNNHCHAFTSGRATILHEIEHRKAAYN